MEGNKIAFLTKDPQYLIDINKHYACNKLKIKFVLLNPDSLLSKLQHKNIVLKNSINEKDIFINEILSSKSWKITEPLRKIKRILTGKTWQ